MQNLSDVFIPDYQQAQRYHNELLTHAKQKRFARLSSGSHNPERFSFGRRLRLLLTNLRTHTTTPITSRKSGAHS